MKEDFKKITDHFFLFEKEAFSRAYSGNIAAGMRARKISLTIEKLMKDYRKKTIEEDKARKSPLSEEKKEEMISHINKGKVSNKPTDKADKRKKKSS